VQVLDLHESIAHQEMRDGDLDVQVGDLDVHVADLEVGDLQRSGRWSWCTSACVLTRSRGRRRPRSALAGAS
jgi:hypothetical protein